MGESWKGYSKESIEWLKEQAVGGFTWSDVINWLANHEKPKVVARLINEGVVQGPQCASVVIFYLRHMFMVAAEGDAMKALEMALWGPDSLHNGKYYLTEYLKSGKVLEKMAGANSERWSKAKGFVGKK